MKRILSILLSILMMFQLMPLSIIAEEPAPGTAQNIKVEQVEGSIYKAFKVTETHRIGTPYEKEETFYVYCFQHDNAFPDEDKTNFYPEELKTLKENPEAMEAVRRVLFAGFPNNGAHLYEPGVEVHATFDILNDMFEMPDEVKNVFNNEGIDISGLNFSFGSDGKGPLGSKDSKEVLAVVQMALKVADLSEDDYNTLVNWSGYKALFPILISYDEDGTNYSAEDVLAMYDGWYPESTTDGSAHKATQDAVWAVLKHFKIEGSEHKNPPKSILSTLLYEFAIGDSPIPSATVTEEQINQNIKLTDYVTPESDDFKIVFKRNPADGRYYSQTLKIMGQDDEGGNTKSPIYDLSYKVSFSDSTEITEVRNNEDFRIELANKPDTSGSVKIKLGTELKWPSKVFEYKTDELKYTTDGIGNPIWAPYQTMGGLYLKEKTLSGEFEYKVAPTGSLEITKNIKEGSEAFAAGDAFEFKIKLTGEGLDGFYPAKFNGEDTTATCVGGVITVNLKKDDVFKVDELPEGTLFEIEETEVEHWNYSLDGSKSGTIAKDETVSVIFTNEYSNKINISGSKEWNDGNNQDGIRPDSIVVELYRNDEKIDSKTVTEASGWAWDFGEYDKYDVAGVEYAYEIKEQAVDNYNTDYNGFDIINIHKPEEVEVTVKKIWNDGNNADNKRPTAGVTFQLYADNKIVEGKTVVMSAATEGVSESDNKNEYTYTFTGLPKKNAGKEIKYTVRELHVPEEYTNSHSDDELIITNTYVPEKTSVDVKKIWVDGNNADGTRPASVTLQLYADGVAVEGKTVVMGDSNPEVTKNKDKTEYSYTFDNLQKYKTGKVLINYTIQEVSVPEGYTATYSDDGHIVTNTHSFETVSVPVKKIWNDGNNADGKRPTAGVTFQLYANDVAVEGKVVVISDSNSEVTANASKTEYSYTFTDLPAKKAGVAIKYTVQETHVPAGYTSSHDTTGLIITNTYVPEKTSVEVKKIWVDGNNADGKRPADGVTFQLYADGVAVEGKTINMADGVTDVTENADKTEYSYTFVDLPKHKNGGTEIVYTVQETTSLADYAVSYSDNKLTVTNTHEPTLIDVTVTKIWDDNNNADGKRPADGVTFQLYANGAKVEGKTLTMPLPTASGTTTTSTFTGLPKMKNGVDITYTVHEVAIPDGYEPIHTSDLTITNKREPDKTFVEVTKIWDDGNNADGKRPTTGVIFHLYKNGVDSGLSVNMNDTTPNVMVSADKNTYTYRFTELPLNEDGTPITYTVFEEVVPNYTTTYSSDRKTVTNKYVPATKDITVTKIWNDGNNADGKRPTDGVTFQLYANGVAVPGKTVVMKAGVTGVSKSLDNNEYTYTFKELPVNEGGVAITYTVQEVHVPAGYTSSHSGNDLIITNTYIPEKTSVDVKKIWVDGNDADGIRPTKASSTKPAVLTLLADGAPTGKTITIKDGEAGLTDSADKNEYYYTFENLPMRKNGTVIKYTVVESVVPDGYSASYSEDTYTITNTHNPEPVDITAKKIWEDGDNADGKRPTAGVTFQLYADGVMVSGKTATMSSATNESTVTFTGLPKKNGGVVIKYTVHETHVPDGYTSSHDSTGLIIKNTYVPEKTTVEVKKIWVDDDNNDGKRPTAGITLQLYADDVAVSGKSVVMADTTPEVTENAGKTEYSYTFTDLPKYKEGGKLIKYTIKEETVPTGYTASYSTDGLTVTNTHESEKTKVTVKKVWNDNNNNDGVRPTEGVTLQLYADDVAVLGKTVVMKAGEPGVIENTDKTEYTYEFTGLSKYKAGKEIKYTVKEATVPTGYTASYSTDGLTVTNTHDPIKTEVSVKKVWNDGSNADGIRPSSVTIKLFADGVPAKDGLGNEITAVVDGSHSWEHTFTDLPKYVSGSEIVYTIEEAPVSGYTTHITGDMATKFVVTNIHEVTPPAPYIPPKTGV